jgi:site-specific recombinase XerD
LHSPKRLALRSSFQQFNTHFATLLRHPSDTPSPPKKIYMQKITVIPVLKKKKPTHSFGTIYIRGYFNNKAVAAVSTGHKVEYSQWDIENKKVIDKAPNAKLINACIQIKVQEMNAELMKLEIMGAKVNRARVKKVVKGTNTSRDFIKYCEEKIRADYNRPETLRTYTSECSKLRKFQDPVCFADIDFDFLTRYRNYMRDTLQNEDNTVWKSLKFVKTFITKAMNEGGIIAEDPFEEFDRGSYTQNLPTWIEKEDCEKIMKLFLQEGTPVIIRRVSLYFLLMCYSGLRFEDAIAFDPDEHVIEDQRLVKRTSKGKGKVINILFYDKLQTVISLIKDNRLQLSNQKFNMWLKSVNALTGIQKTLTAHVGRHTFGGFLADAGIPEEIAKELLGHHDIKSTRIYYHMKNKTIDQAVGKLNEK